MKAVEQSSDYYQRLLDKLSSTEDRIESLNERIATLEAERVERSDRLGQYLQDLTIK
jgi:septal ring factor EnvC (AmiA/AmiB activator)